MNNIDPLGIDNVCFSQSESIEDNERKIKFRNQRLEVGFDDSELWALDYTIAKFIYPRLIRFRDLEDKNDKEWIDKLNKMIKSFELIIDMGGSSLNLYKEESLIILDGLKLFYENYFELWN